MIRRPIGEVLPDAQRTWHYLAEVPNDAKNAITSGRDTIVGGHPLSAPIDADAPNHVHWDSVCSVACGRGLSYNDPQEHIITFDLHFKSGFGWNKDTSKGHGDFNNLDLWQVAAHEWGHVVGMGHSDTLSGHDCTGSGNVNNGWATMTQGTGGCFNNGHTEQRSLHADDEAGRCDIYQHAHNYSC